MEISKKCPICSKRFEGGNKTCSKVCSYKKRGRERRKDITGVKKGKLTAVERVKTNSNGHSVWRFKCDCGNFTETIYGDFTRAGKGSVRSCGCLLKRSGTESPIFSGYEEITGALWTRIKKSAEVRNLEFKININFAYKLFLTQDKKCILSGVPITIGQSASIDRVDSRLGYTNGNIQWVHKDINKLKNNFTQEYFIEMCNFVSDNSK